MSSAALAHEPPKSAAKPRRNLRVGDQVYYWQYSPGIHDTPRPAMVMFVHDDGGLNLTIQEDGFQSFVAQVLPCEPGAIGKARMGRWSHRD